MLPWRPLACAGWLACRRCNGAAGAPLFVESAAAVGPEFTHVTGATGQYYMAEQMGAGVALFDYDNDGDLDVFLRAGRAARRRRAGATRTRAAGCSATI